MESKYQVCDNCASLLTPFHAEAARTRGKIIDFLKGQNGTCAAETIAEELGLSNSTVHNQLTTISTLNLGMIVEKVRKPGCYRYKSYYGFPKDE